MKNKSTKIYSIEIINTNWSIIGPDDISEVKTKVYRDGHLEINTYKNNPKKPFETHEYKISDKEIDLFFSKLISDIKVLDWKDDYSVVICDGYHWDVIIHFTNGTQKKSQGTVDPPTNGKLLREMIYELINHQIEPWIF